MAASPGIVAHLIIGQREEPYLSAVIAAITPVCSHLVVNDNSVASNAANDLVLARSPLALAGCLTVARTPFTGFADARNACIDATPAAHRSGWVLFVDADEVHGEQLPRMASLLPNLQDDVDAVDGYSRHFVGSFSWWRSVERRLCFFRYRQDRRWVGRVHEQLEPIGRRIALPCVWPHYGHVVTPKMEWEKSRLYSSLGQPGFAPTDDDLRLVTAEQAWMSLRRDAMRYHGDHPDAARDTIARLSREWSATFDAVDRLFAGATVFERLRRRVRAVNFARLVAFRGIEALARWGWAA